MKNRIKQQFKQGGASMFLVIVSCMFVAVIVASFVRLMIQDQQRASEQDLSQSAYDSAQAGVEDAKIFLNKWNSECGSGTNVASGSVCEKMAKSLQAEDASCNMLNSGGIGVSSGETVIQSTQDSSDKSGEELNQAYTCVKIAMNTPDYLGDLAVNGSIVIRLKPEKDAEFIRLSWHSDKDLTDQADKKVDIEDKSGDIALPTSWKAGRPAVLEAQLSGVNYGTTRSLDQLDGAFQGGNGLSRVTLYPSGHSSAYDTSGTLPRTLGLGLSGGVDNVRRNDTQKVYPAKCQKSLASGGYACSLILDVPTLSAAPTQYTLLRLATLYAGTNYKVEMLDASKNVVNFDGIQPKVDSNGRANDRFRRVETRLNTTDNNFPMPDFEIYEGGADKQPLCKDFWVTNTQTNLSENCE